MSRMSDRSALLLQTGLVGVAMSVEVTFFESSNFVPGGLVVHAAQLRSLEEAAISSLVRPDFTDCGWASGSHPSTANSSCL
jgi:hypothetical protein